MTVDELDRLQALVLRVLTDVAGIRLESAGPPIDGMSVIRMCFLKRAGERRSVQGIERFARDLQLATGRPSVRIHVGRVVSVELPKHESERRFAPILPLLREAPGTAGEPSVLAGRTQDGLPYALPLDSCLHILVGGETGGGKSVLLHTMLFGFFFRYPPSRLRVNLIDFKREEFAHYERAPHLWRPVVSDRDLFGELLRDLDRELQRRTRLDARQRTRAMPPFVTVIDEFRAPELRGDDVERLTRLIAMGRSARMHYVLATQHPTTDAIPSQIVNNLPTRFALATAGATASRVILGTTGAERLLKRGDCLVRGPRGEERIQCGLVTEADLDAVRARLEAGPRVA